MTRIWFPIYGLSLLTGVALWLAAPARWQLDPAQALLFGSGLYFGALHRYVRRGLADEVQLVAIFDQLAFRSDARSFRGGSVDCWFGGGAVDLRDATLDPDGATLRMRTIFGGGQIVVPESWRVVNDVVVIAGGVADTRSPADRPDDAPELRLEGLAAFGGFVIASELPAGAEQAMFHTPA